MKHWILAIGFLCIATIAMADQSVVFEWLPGNCTDAFRIYRSTSKGWVEVAEVIQPSISIVVPTYSVRWRVSGVCTSGSNKGEWWLQQGVWTGKNVFNDMKR